MRRVPPFGLLVASIILITLLHLFLPVLKLIPYPYNLSGLLPLVVGLVVYRLAVRECERHRATTHPYEKPNVLVTSGVFGHSRNPMYLGGVLFLLGIVVLTGSLSPYVVVVACLTTLQRVWISREEKLLEERFGSEWIEYERNVRRWL